MRFLSIIRSRFVRQWQSVPLMDRWILAELSAPLLFGIGAFTAVSFSVGAVFEVLRRISETSISPDVVLRILLMQLPGFMVLSFPMATLMATLLAYGKLSGSSELTALRSLGVSAWRIVVPGVILASMMSVLTFSFNEWIVPPSMLGSKNLLNASIGKAVIGQSTQDIVYSQFGDISIADGKTSRGLTTFFSAREHRNNIMYGITLLDLSNVDRQIMLQADEGAWNGDNGQWVFRNGRIYMLPSPTQQTISSADFETFNFTFGAEPIEAATLPKDFDVFSNTLTIGQARTAERLLRESGQTRRARKFQVRIQEKFSFPAVCLVFGLLGSSLGSRPTSRQSTSQGFGMTVVFLFCYYLMAYISSMLGVNGILPPFLAAWFPVVIGLVVGSVLMTEASR